MLEVVAQLVAQIGASTSQAALAVMSVLRSQR